MARDIIRHLRKQKKVSQAALARAAGLTPAEISRIECGYRDLSASEAAAISQALGVAVHEINERSAVAPSPSAPAPSPTATPTAPQSKPSQPPPFPPGNDLNDPANFRELPNTLLLTAGASESARSALRVAVDRATKVLHTSRVPAAIWRAWRDFERQAQEILRTSGASISAPQPTNGHTVNMRTDGRDTLGSAERSFRAGQSSRMRHREKSYNAVFLECARSVLPPARAAEITHAAEMRSHRDGCGFVRAFREIAQNTLAISEIRLITESIVSGGLGAHHLGSSRS